MGKAIFLGLGAILGLLAVSAHRRPKFSVGQQLPLHFRGMRDQPDYEPPTPVVVVGISAIKQDFSDPDYGDLMKGEDLYLVVGKRHIDESTQPDYSYAVERNGRLYFTDRIRPVQAPNGKFLEPEYRFTR